ncbi:MAG: SH3 domain-containing protein [Acutalibacteraceae bacterium]
MSEQRYIPKRQSAKRYATSTPISSTVLYRHLTVLASAVALAALPVTAVCVNAATTATTTDVLNLRKGAGTNYGVVEVLNNNTKVTVLDTSNNAWFKVMLNNGTTGYCSADYLNISGKAVVSTALNLRKGAGTGYSSITVMPKGTAVTILSTSGSWARVKTSDGVIGYCAVEYLTMDTSVVLSSSKINLGVGSTEKLTADTAVTWSSSNTSVVSVNSDGTLKALKTGTATVKAKSKANSASTASCTVIVTEQALKSIQLSETSKTLYIGEVFQLKATTTPANFTLKYSTDNTKAVRVGGDGTVTALAEGTANITVTDEIGLVKAVCTVTVKAVPELIEESHCVAIGGVRTLACSAAKWDSENPNIAVADSKGNVTGVKVGTTYINAYDEGNHLIFRSVMTVQDKGFTSITIQNQKTTACIGESFNLNAVTNTGKGSLYYRSRNESIATVDGKGNVTAVGEGTAVIVVYDKTATIKETLTVKVKELCMINSIQSTASVSAGSSIRLDFSTNDSDALQWTSSNESVAAVKNGVVSGFKSGTATITATTPSGDKKSCTVTVNSVSTGSVVGISRSASSVCVGQTLYLTGWASKSNVRWKSSNTAIATVSDGFVYAKSTGKVAITVNDANGHTAVCVVTVKEAEPVQFVYSQPNSATLNSTVTLIAITDTNRDSVKFVIDENGTKKEVTATSKVKEDGTYVWKANYKATTAGTFAVKAYSTLKGSTTWETCNGGTADIFVSEQTSKTQTAVRELRASSEMIAFIAEKEGFVSEVTADTLANNIPTIGHGYVVWEGETFYNNLTKSQGFALLVRAVNEDSYTSKVNAMLIDNNVAFNQQQFDALVSFSYNLGTGWTSSSDLKNILLNSIGTDTSSTVLTGTVNASTGLNLRKSPTTSSEVITILPNGSTVTLLSSEKYNSVWYKVKTSDGTIGYCSSSYLVVKTTNAVRKDLNFVNKNALIKEMLAYHHAGGVCYYGLLYRRADELEMFLYGDYVSDGRNNKHNFPDPVCISFP